MKSYINPSIKELVKDLNEAMKPVSKANCGLLNNPPAPPAPPAPQEVFDNALEALAKLEDELRLIRAYIEESKRNHERQGA